RNSRQFRSEARELLVVTANAALEPDGLAFYPAAFAKTFFERARGLGAAHHYADDWHALCWLRLGADPHKQVGSENDREPDQPHGTSMGMAGGSLADDGCSQELAAIGR